VAAPTLRAAAPVEPRHLRRQQGSRNRIGQTGGNRLAATGQDGGGGMFQ
jgi:hypothetical protein